MSKSQFVQQARKDLANFYRKADIDFMKYNASVAWRLGAIRKGYEKRRERV